MDQPERRAPLRRMIPFNLRSYLEWCADEDLEAFDAVMDEIDDRTRAGAIAQEDAKLGHRTLI